MHSTLSTPINNHQLSNLSNSSRVHVHIYILFCSSAAIATTHLHYKNILMSCTACIEKEQWLIFYAALRWEYVLHKNTSATHMNFWQGRIQFSLRVHLPYMELHVLISFLAPVQYAYFWKFSLHVCKFSRLGSLPSIVPLLQTAQQLLVPWAGHPP